MSGTTTAEIETCRPASSPTQNPGWDEPADKAKSSCLYIGTVLHRRFSPVEHHFERKLAMLLIDLDEVDEVFRTPGLWSTKRWSLFQFRRSDYLGPLDRPLIDCVRELVEQRLGRRPDGPIRLLTQIRSFGLVFNPVSLYYCYDATGKQLEAIVADVTNTPWRERYAYVIPFTADRSGGPFQCTKEFHVSPFMPMEMRYHWRVTAPADRLTVQIENHDAAERVFDATLQLQRYPLSFRNLLWMAIRFPLMSAQIVAAIYWQALRLWRKKAPYHPHPPEQPAAPLPDITDNVPSTQPVEELR